MFLLQLQQISPSASKDVQVFAVARSENVELLRELYIAEMVTPYKDSVDDGTECVVTKKFRKGGPLEWYLPLDNPQEMFLDVGTKEARLEQLIADIREKVEQEWASIEANTLACSTREELLQILKTENQND